jgi:hypothetical protein
MTGGRSSAALVLQPRTASSADADPAVSDLVGTLQDRLRDPDPWPETSRYVAELRREEVAGHCLDVARLSSGVAL